MFVHKCTNSRQGGNILPPMCACVRMCVSIHFKDVYGDDVHTIVSCAVCVACNVCVCVCVCVRAQVGVQGKCVWMQGKCVCGGVNVPYAPLHTQCMLCVMRRTHAAKPTHIQTHTV